MNQKQNKPKPARTKNSTNQTGHETKRARTKNQKEHKPKIAQTKNGTSLKGHESKTAGTKNGRNQKGHESKSGYLWKIEIFQPKYNSFVRGN